MDEDKEKRLVAKRAFFDELHKVHDDKTEDEEDEALLILSGFRKRLKSAAVVEHNVPFLSARLLPAMGRTVSSPLPAANMPAPCLHAVDCVMATPTGTPRSHVPRGSRSAINVKPTMIQAPRTVEQTKPGTKGSKKRKRSKSLEILPESQQIFGGKVFFFLPNDRIAPARALRIRKAQEWGASWTKELRTGVTHIIAESYLHYEDVVKYLKIDAIPEGVVLVNETYVSDCIMYRYLLNPSQDIYNLNRQKTTVAVEHTPTSSTSSSLPIRPDGTRVLQTPSRTEGSDEAAANRDIELLVQQISSQRAEANRSLNKARATRPRDALDEAIEEAAEVEGLPLDPEENDLSVSFKEVEGSSGDDDIKSPSRPSRVTKHPGPSQWQNAFSCMQKHDGFDSDSNPNARTIEILQKMATYYDRMQDKWRVLAYRKAIAALRKQPKKIATREEALAIPCIGSRLADKIEEIATTDRLRRLDNTSVDNPDDAVLQLFLAVYGVGFTQARTWILQGHRTLASLMESASLTVNQRIGVEHYEDFLSRIPRAETEMHAAFLRKHLTAICPTLELTVGGSYRRGAANSGDIDFLITSQTRSLSALRSLLVDSLLPRLFAVRYLRTTLASCDQVKGTKWLGAACLPAAKEQIWRRVDFLLVPWEQMGAALIYWTGNDIFNRSMRLLASKRGMRLNQHGLYKNVLRGPGRVKLTEGELVESRSEKAIFERLGVPWRPPEHRIC